MPKRTSSVFEWLTTGAMRENGEPRGWKLHAVLGATDKMKGAEVAKLSTACGLAPRSWGLDLFIEKKCARCLYVLGLACPRCKGNGSGKGSFCMMCNGTGEEKP